MQQANVWRDRDTGLILKWNSRVRESLCTDLIAEWQRLGGSHELHHKERLRLSLEQLRQEATKKFE